LTPCLLEYTTSLVDGEPRHHSQHHDSVANTEPRAFTTVRRLTTPSVPVAIPRQAPSHISSLSRAFSGLSIRPTSVFSTSMVRPSIGPASVTASAISQQLAAVQTREFSSSAMLCGPRDTYNPSRRVQKRRHGYLARLKTKAGRDILKRRRLKGRRDLSW